MIKQELQSLAQQPWQASSLVASPAPFQALEAAVPSHTLPASTQLTPGTSKAQASSSALFTFQGHQSAVSALIWLPDSMHVVSAGPSSIEGSGLLCWNISTGQVLFSSSDYSCALTGSPKSRIAFGTEEGLQVRAFPTGEVLYSASVLGNFSLTGLRALAWSPGGAYLACGTDNGTVVLWDVVSHNIFARMRLHGSEIHSLAWSPDSTQLVLGCDDAKMCVLCITHKTNRLQKKPQPTLEQACTFAGNYLSGVAAVAWSPDGKYIIGNIGGRIYATHPSGGTGRWFDDTKSTVNAVAWSPDSKYIVSGHNDQVLRVWGADAGSIVTAYTGHTERINAVAWSPDGKYIVSGSQDHSVRVWQWPAPEQQKETK